MWKNFPTPIYNWHLLPNMATKLPIIREPFKGDHNAVTRKLKRKHTKPTHRRTDANLYLPERQLTKASEPSFVIPLFGDTIIKKDPSLILTQGNLPVAYICKPVKGGFNRL